MARTSANSVGPATRTAISSISEQLDAQIARSLKDFHNHSKDCCGCRNPVLAYQNNKDLCETGRGLCVQIAKLLYKKAEHVPEGAFTIEYKRGWEAVDGLIRIIVHYNQGYYSNKIIDLKRVAPTPAPDIPRGSLYDEDLRRQQRAAAAADWPRRSPQQQSAANLAVYGDPRTSFLDVQRNQTQAGTPEVSPASSSSRSVHWDSHIHIREFHS